MLKTYTGHKNRDFPIQSLFDNRDASVISGSEDGSFYWWNLEDGKLLQSKRGHNARLVSVDYHPTENYLLTTSSDEKIKLWELKNA